MEFLRPPPVDLPPPSSLFSDSEGDSNPTSPEVAHAAPPKPSSSRPAAPLAAKFRTPTSSVPPPKAPIMTSTAMKPVPTSVSVSAYASGADILSPEIESPSAVAPSAAVEASSRRTVVVDLRQSIQKALQDVAEVSSRREGGLNHLKGGHHSDDDDDEEDDDWHTHRKLIKKGSMSVRVSEKRRNSISRLKYTF